MDTIAIVYKVSWEVADHWFNEIDHDLCVDSGRMIDKIFYKSEDAVKYINSIPNQSYPPNYIELLDNPDEYEFATGFYLMDMHYLIELET